LLIIACTESIRTETDQDTFPADGDHTEAQETDQSDKDIEFVADGDVEPYEAYDQDGIVLPDGDLDIVDVIDQEPWPDESDLDADLDLDERVEPDQDFETDVIDIVEPDPDDLCAYDEDCPLYYSCDETSGVCYSDLNVIFCDQETDCVSGYICYVSPDSPDGTGKCIPDPMPADHESGFVCHTHADCPDYEYCDPIVYLCNYDDNAEPCEPAEGCETEGYYCAELTDGRHRCIPVGLRRQNR